MPYPQCVIMQFNNCFYWFFFQSNADLCMYVLLPNKIDGISEMEDKFSKTDLSKILNHVRNLEVIVTLPKFKLEETIDFDETLKEVSIYIL